MKTVVTRYVGYKWEITRALTERNGAQSEENRLHLPESKNAIIPIYTRYGYSASGTRDVSDAYLWT